MIDAGESLERMSAVMDGEADAAALARACGGWRDDARARDAWHTWHVIGDVLRSEDLAADAPRDARLLSAVRERLTDEPVWLMPAVGAAAAAGHRVSRRRAWGAGAAVAAGFVAVAGTVMVLQAPPAPAPSRAAQALPLPQAVAPVAEAPPEALSRMIRDARLEEYLAAHKQFGGSTALGVPSQFLRSATVDVPAR